MGVWSFLSGGVTETIGEVAKEWITTDMESAEAKSLFVKTLDPNGSMRRQISKNVTEMYMVYIYLTGILVLGQSFGVGDGENVKLAISSLTDLFVPITNNKFFFL